jgi:AcrR family transcriptional regulator
MNVRLGRKGELIMVRAGLSTERVTVAGAELADQIGFEAVTAAELARRLGVRTASLYSHVESSANLKSRIAALALNELADRVADALAGRTRVEALAGMAGAYRDYARQHPGRFAATLATNTNDEAVLVAARRHAQLAQAMLRGYDLDADAVTHATRFVGSTLRGFATLELNGSFDHSTPPAADSWAYTVAALDVLLSNWPAAPCSAGASTKPETSTKED